MSGKKLLLLVLGAFALLLLGAFLLWNEATKAELADAQQRLRDAHLPMTIADIRPPSVPDADNAALVIAKIKPMLDALPQVGGEDFSLWFGNFQGKHKEMRLDEAALKELAEQFDSPPVQTIIALIHEAAGKKGFNSNTDYSQGVQTRFPSMSPLQQSAKLLGWHARLAVSRNQMDEALADVWAKASLADFAPREPTLIAFLTSAAIWGITLDDIERLAATERIPPEWSNKFSARLADLKLHASFAAVLDGERIVIAQPEFDGIMAGTTRIQDSILQGMEPSALANLLIYGYRISGVVRLDNASFLDGMAERRRIVTAGLRDFPSYERRLKSIPEIPSWLILSRIMLSTYDSMGKHLWKSQAKVTIAQAGLALERYRAAKGGYPAALADLAPDFIKEVPPDVFTGKPLLYRPEPGGAVIYSVGPNQTDDAGIENREDDKDDISWASGTAATRKFTPPSPAPGETEP